MLVTVAAVAVDDDIITKMAAKATTTTNAHDFCIAVNVQRL